MPVGENWAKERMGGGGKEKEKDIPKNDWRGEKYPFRRNSIVWDPQILQKKKKGEKGGGGGLVRENGWSHTQYKKIKKFFRNFQVREFHSPDISSP